MFVLYFVRFTLVISFEFISGSYFNSKFIHREKTFWFQVKQVCFLSRGESQTVHDSYDTTELVLFVRESVWMWQPPFKSIKICSYFGSCVNLCTAPHTDLSLFEHKCSFIVLFSLHLWHFTFSVHSGLIYTYFITYITYCIYSIFNHCNDYIIFLNVLLFFFIAQPREVASESWIFNSADAQRRTTCDLWTLLCPVKLKVNT